MKVAVSPNLLSWACDRSGHSQESYLKRFPRLTSWISGEVQPTLKQLEDFARATHAPIGYFFLPEPPDEKIPIPDFRTIGGKGIHRPSPELLNTVYICQQRQEWYRDFARSMHESPLSFVGKFQPTADVVGAAAEIRDTLGFDLNARRQMGSWTEALRRFVDQADTAGIMVMCSGVVLNNNNRPLDPDEFRGFAISDELAPLVFINGADTKSAQMFTLAHELAHIWLGQSALSDVSVAETSTHQVERWCNRVAAELLVPIEAFTADFRPKVKLNTEVERLANRYKVSKLVILRRAHDAGAISKKQMVEEYGAELRRIHAQPRSGGGNFYLTLPSRVSKRFARALVVSTLEGQTLHRDALRMLGFSKVKTFRQLGESLGVIR